MTPRAALSFCAPYSAGPGQIAIKIAAALCLLLASFAGGGAAYAQGGASFTWVAKVDDDVISNYELSQRARILQLENPNVKGRPLFQRALQELIEESLKVKEAKRANITISDEELAGTVKQVISSNRQSEASFFAALDKAGVDRSSFERRLRVTMLWNQVLRRRHLSKIRPSEAEVESAVQSVQGGAGGAKVYNVRQLVIDVPPAASNRETEALFRQAVKLRKDLKSCEQIKEKAPKYSRISGDLGWLKPGQMPGPVRAEVVKMEVGDTAKPLKSQHGWHVVILCGVKREGEAPNVERIRNQLANRKMANVSRSIVSDLRRDASIELAQ